MTRVPVCRMYQRTTKTLTRLRRFRLCRIFFFFFRLAYARKYISNDAPTSHITFLYRNKFIRDCLLSPDSSIGGSLTPRIAHARRHEFIGLFIEMTLSFIFKNDFSHHTTVSQTSTSFEPRSVPSLTLLRDEAFPEMTRVVVKCLNGCVILKVRSSTDATRAQRLLNTNFIHPSRFTMKSSDGTPRSGVVAATTSRMAAKLPTGKNTDKSAMDSLASSGSV